MTYGNLIKNKIQHPFGGLFNRLSIERKLTDVQMECMRLAPPHPIRRSTKPISKIIILGIEMIFSF